MSSIIRTSVGLYPKHKKFFDKNASLNMSAFIRQALDRQIDEYSILTDQNEA